MIYLMIINVALTKMLIGENFKCEFGVKLKQNQSVVLVSRAASRTTTLD